MRGWQKAFAVSDSTCLRVDDVCRLAGQERSRSVRPPPSRNLSVSLISLVSEAGTGRIFMNECSDFVIS